MKSNHFIIFYLLLSALIIACSSSEDERILNYYYEGRIFSVEEHEENFQIVIKEIVQCIVSPCIPPILEVVSIKNEEDNNALKELFDELFKDPNKKERSLFEDELSARQFRIISNILERIKF